MSCEPEDDLDVGVVPAVSKVMCEEAPWVVIVLVWEQNADALLILWACVVVVAPDYTQVQWAGRCHNSDVRQGPSAVVVGERVNGLEEEWVTRNRAHGIVGDTSGECAANPGWVCEKRIEAAVASLTKISMLL